MKQKGVYNMQDTNGKSKMRLSDITIIKNTFAGYTLTSGLTLSILRCMSVTSIPGNRSLTYFKM